MIAYFLPGTFAHCLSQDPDPFTAEIHHEQAFTGAFNTYINAFYPHISLMETNMMTCGNIE